MPRIAPSTPLLRLALAGGVAALALPLLAAGFWAPPDHPSCDNTTFPKVAAFRSADGYAVEWDEDTGLPDVLGETDPAQDFACFEAAIEPNRPDNGQFLIDVELAWPQTETIARESWATVGCGEISGDTITSHSVYPGHWLFGVGWVVQSGAPSGGETTLTVDTSARDLADEDLLEGRMGALYALDPSGAPDWTQMEHFEITDVDESAGTITIDGEPDAAWQQATTDVRFVPHIHTWKEGCNLTVNLSIDGPQDASGRAGWEWFADYLIDRYDDRHVYPGKAWVDGIQMDGGRWWPEQGGNHNHHVDADNDQAADWGHQDPEGRGGVNYWGLGGQRFLEDLRAQLDTRDPDAIVIADSSSALYGHRGLQFMDGIEIENFPEGAKAHEDADRSAFSSAFLHIRHAIEEVDGWGQRDPLSYALTKRHAETYRCQGDGTIWEGPGDLGDTGDTGDDDPEAPHGDAWFRVGLATSLMLGMPHPFAPENDDDPDDPHRCWGVFEWDEYVGGQAVLDNEAHISTPWGWLGQPVSAAERVTDDLDSTDLLASAAWSTATRACPNDPAGAPNQVVQSLNGSAPLSHEIVEICAAPDWRDARIRTDWLGETIEAGAYTLIFEVTGHNEWPGEVDPALVDHLPRPLAVRLQVDDASGTQTNHIQHVLLPPGETRTYHLTFLELPVKGTIERVEFGSGAQIGALHLHGAALYRGSAERWVRFFEGGAAVLNMSPNAWTYDLDQGHPPGMPYAYIDGDQAPTVNTGADLDGGGFEVQVAPMDAVLVVAKPQGSGQ